MKVVEARGSWSKARGRKTRICKPASEKPGLLTAQIQAVALCQPNVGDGRGREREGLGVQG